MEERRAETWLELQELLFADSWNDDLGLFRSSFAYRGSSDASADLSSGLVRLGAITCVAVAPLGNNTVSETLQSSSTV